MNEINIKLINAFLKRDRQRVNDKLDSYTDFYSAATSYNESPLIP